VLRGAGVLIELRSNVPLPNGDGVADFVYLYWREDIARHWRNAPTLILDATLPESIVRLNYPQLEVVDLNVDMPHVHVRQIRDKALPEKMMIPSRTAGKRKNAERMRNVERLCSYLRVEADRLRCYVARPQAQFVARSVA
jgi:hypothetical protein